MKRSTAIHLTKQFAAMTEDVDAILAAMPVARMTRAEIEAARAAAKAFMARHRTIMDALRALDVDPPDPKEN